jgi:aryl-alcohol dehydrogenase-like predicted oxidoreductase
MDMRTLGVALRAPALRLGCAGMSGVYGPPDDVESTATICAAIDAGITLLDSRGIEDRILATCRELGIGITAYGVLALVDSER